MNKHGSASQADVQPFSPEDVSEGQNGSDVDEIRSVVVDEVGQSSVRAAGRAVKERRTATVPSSGSFDSALATQMLQTQQHLLQSQRQITEVIEGINRRINSIEDLQSSISETSNVVGQSRVTSPVPSVEPPRMRPVVIQQPSPALEKTDDRDGSSRSLQHAATLIPDSTEEEVWSTPNASPERDSRSRSQSCKRTTGHFSSARFCRSQNVDPAASTARGRSRSRRPDCSNPSFSSTGADDQRYKQQSGSTKGQGAGGGDGSLHRSSSDDKRRKNANPNGNDGALPPDRYGSSKDSERKRKKSSPSPTSRRRPGHR